MNLLPLVRQVAGVRASTLWTRTAAARPQLLPFPLAGHTACRHTIRAHGPGPCTSPEHYQSSKHLSKPAFTPELFPSRLYHSLLSPCHTTLEVPNSPRSPLLTPSQAVSASPRSPSYFRVHNAFPFWFWPSVFSLHSRTKQPVLPPQCSSPDSACSRFLFGRLSEITSSVPEDFPSPRLDL